MKIVAGTHTFRSKTDQNAGKTPHWTDVFEFKRNTEELIMFYIFDEDVTTDDLVGQGVFDLNRIIEGPSNTFCDYIPIEYKARNSGDFFVELTFHPLVPSFGSAPRPLPLPLPLGPIPGPSSTLLSTAM